MDKKFYDNLFIFLMQHDVLKYDANDIYLT